MFGVGTTHALMTYRWGDQNPTFREQLENGHVQMGQTDMDLSNDGVPERVVLMRYRNCVNGPPPMIVVVDQKTGKTDPRFGFVRGGYVPFTTAGRTYLLGHSLWSPGDEWELVEPWGGYRGGPSAPRAPGEEPVYGKTRVCLFEHVTH